MESILTIQCVVCEDTGFVNGNDGLLPCKCKKEKLIKENLLKSEIPLRFKNKNFQSYKTKHEDGKDIPGRELNIEKMQKYISIFQKTKQGLILFGKSGTGKTHLAVSVLKELINQGYTGMFYNSVDLLSDIKSSFNQKQGEDAKTESEIFKKTQSADILLIDDMGVDKVSEWVRQTFYAIINKRYQDEKAVIITTNCTHLFATDKDDLLSLQFYIGQRVVSRLAEMCIKYKMPDGDYRRLGDQWL